MVSRENSPAVLLATAQIRIKSANGEHILLRALVDQGSQKTTISEEASQLLNLPPMKSKTEIYGLGGTKVGVSKNKIKIQIQPRFSSDYLVTAEALILPALTSVQPEKTFKQDIEEWKNYVLADPLYNKSDRIDVVIGSDIFGDILEEGVIKKCGILGQSTKLGWILSGAVTVNADNNKIVSAMTSIEKFWELEEVRTETESSNEDELCLKIYKDTTKLEEKGRITVKIPFKEDCALGESRKQAVARFLALEKRMAQDVTLKNEYAKFIDEYQKLGHM
ncbi:uncharacterized protein LOC118732308, partial [Rhagoletis pomonella]|uniref:uncharacterized protein LOC118732308 n=1 Tax=Rhagoletis pomonella TaxID=28610 RepID=UPI00177BB49B